MKDTRATFTNSQTYGLNTGIPVAVAERIAALEKKLKRKKK